MHPTAMRNCQYFFDSYAGSFPQEQVRVIEIGAQDVNGSLRTVTPGHYDYLGIDFVAGNGVDLVLEDPYVLPLPDDSVDIVLSSSCFEHSEMFWISFLEIMRVLKPHGLFYLNAPSNGPFHRYPVDCWRFYPDSGKALVNWAKRNGIRARLLESYTSYQQCDTGEPGLWNDFISVILKDEGHLPSYPRRITDSKTNVMNVIRDDLADLANFADLTEDQQKLRNIRHVVSGY